MTKTQSHRERHEHLHKCLAELVADFIMENTNASLQGTSILELMKWSAAEREKGGNDELITAIKQAPKITNKVLIREAETCGICGGVYYIIRS